MVTIKDIAREAGVSYGTVSCVLNGKAKKVRISDKTIQKVLATAQKMGYQRNDLARSVVTGKSRVIGFLSTETTSEHCGRILSGVMNSAAKHDNFIKVIQITEKSSPEEIAGICQRQRFDGIVCYQLIMAGFIEKLHELLTGIKIPMAVVGGSYRKIKGIHVAANNEMGGRLVFEHLYSLGHRDFFVPFEYSENNWAIDRCNGFLNGAKAAGISIPEKWRPEFQGSFQHSSQYLRTVFSGKKHPTAIFCLSDYTALFILTELYKRSFKVPEDISLVGYGNFTFASNCSPGITSIEERLIELGERCVEILLEDISRPVCKCFTEDIFELSKVELSIKQSAGLKSK